MTTHAYAITLRPRQDTPGAAVEVTYHARTQGAAKRQASREHPDHVLAAVRRVEETTGA